MQMRLFQFQKYKKNTEIHIIKLSKNATDFVVVSIMFTPRRARVMHLAGMYG